MQLPASVLERILRNLVSRERWTRVVALLTDAQDRSDERVALGAAIDVTAYIESNHSLSNPHQRAQHLKLLLACGAQAEARCVRRAAQRPDYPCLPALLRHGAPPADLVLKKGTTPLHAALHIGLELDKGTSLLYCVLWLTKGNVSSSINICLVVKDNLEVLNRTRVDVAGTSFMAFHFMLDSLSRMNDKDKQQVCNDISISVWEC